MTDVPAAAARLKPGVRVRVEFIAEPQGRITDFHYVRLGCIDRTGLRQPLKGSGRSARSTVCKRTPRPLSATSNILHQGAAFKPHSDTTQHEGRTSPDWAPRPSRPLSGCGDQSLRTSEPGLIQGEITSMGGEDVVWTRSHRDFSAGSCCPSWFYGRRLDSRPEARLNLSLTGGTDDYGKAARMGLQLALKEYNDKGGYKGQKVEAVIYDDETKPAKGVENVTRLITRDKVFAIVGPVNSGVALAIIDIAQKNRDSADGHHRHCGADHRALPERAEELHFPRLAQRRHPDVVHDRLHQRPKIPAHRPDARLRPAGDRAAATRRSACSRRPTSTSWPAPKCSTRTTRT